MEVGSINSKDIYNNVQNAQTKSTDGDFEKKLRAAAEKGDDSELREVCKDFEGIFVRMMYKQMKATVPKSDYLQSDSATEIYNSMLDDELCDAISKRGIGLGGVMYKQLSRQYKNSEVPLEAGGGVIDETK